jgi:ELWxxDGT repeat protein
VSRSAVWRPGALYDCPAGFHWASTAEGESLFAGPPFDADAGAAPPPPPGALSAAARAAARTRVYADQCGWRGLTSPSGVSGRRWFRFSDSHLTGAAKDALDAEDAPPQRGRFDAGASATSQPASARGGFAGIVCVAGDIAQGAALDGDAALAASLGAGFAGSYANASELAAAAAAAALPALPLSAVCGADPRGAAPCYARAGRELWATTDGTAAGTQRLLDLSPGTASADPTSLAPFVASAACAPGWTCRAR